MDFAVAQDHLATQLLLPRAVAEGVESAALNSFRHTFLHLIGNFAVESDGEGSAGTEVAGKLDEGRGLGCPGEGLDQEVVLGLTGGEEDGFLFGGPGVCHGKAFA